MVIAQVVVDHLLESSPEVFHKVDDYLHRLIDVFVVVQQLPNLVEDEIEVVLVVELQAVVDELLPEIGIPDYEQKLLNS